MKAKQASKEVFKAAELERVLTEVQAVADSHKAFGVAIENQRNAFREAEEKINALGAELDAKEIDLALSYEAPDLQQKEEHVVSLRGELEKATVAAGRSKRMVEALETKSKDINQAVESAKESLLAYAREFAAHQAADIAIEIREASVALALAVGKARGIGMGVIRPLSVFLEFVCVPDPFEASRYYNVDHQSYMVTGRSLIADDAPALSEAKASVASTWSPLHAALGTLDRCSPFKPVPPAAAPYVRKSWTISEGPSKPAIQKPEPKPFEAHSYEIRDGLANARAAQRGITENIDGVGAATREWLDQIEREQAEQ